jgi:hypothetical protein
MDQIIGDISKGVQTRSRLASFCEHYSFVSSGEPTRVEEVVLLHFVNITLLFLVVNLLGLKKL